MYELPKFHYIEGIKINIRSDYRAILDIIQALSDNELDEQEKAYVALNIFYEDIDKITDFTEACKYLSLFIAGGEEEGCRKNKLIDWEQDFKLIVAPINKAVGRDIRSDEYMHWWTFLGFFQEIGDCLFSHVVNIRNKKLKGKKLEKHEMAFWRENRRLIEFKKSSLFSEEEKRMLEELHNTGGEVEWQTEN